MKSGLFYLWIVSFAKFIYTTPTWENCAAEARRLNRTITYAGFTSDTMVGEQLPVPRLDVDGLGLHPRTKRFLNPMSNDNGPGLATDEVANLSLCPWRFERDINLTRIPSILFKAVCYHNNGDNSCNLPYYGTSNIITVLMRRIECAVFYSAVEVAYECCHQGVYSLIKEWVDWPVACTCARRRVRIVNATQN